MKVIQIVPLYIHKASDAVTGKIQSTTRLRGCALLVETQNGNQAMLLLEVNVPSSYPIHELLNSSLRVVKV
jgi:hypothetical protein